MRMRVSLNLALLALFTAGSSTSCGEAFGGGAEVEAFERLDASFSEQGLRAEDAREGELFRQLLGTKAGRARVRRLADEHDTIAYHEAGETVYFVHPRHAGSDTSCLGTVVLEQRDGMPLLGHAGVPDFLRLTGVRIEGDELTVRAAVSAAPGDRGNAEVFGLTPGETYDRSVSLQDVAGRLVTLEDLGLEAPKLR